MIYIEDVNYTRINVINEEMIRPLIGESVVNGKDHTRVYTIVDIIRADKTYIICHIQGRHCTNHWELVKGVR